MSDGLPPLREIIKAHGLQAKKSLGQNFILDLNLTSKIARGALPLADKTIVEVGPGPGGLTRALLLEGAKQVIAIDLDRRIKAVMDEISDAYPDQLTFLEGDALSFKPEGLEPPVWIVANLPYNIATPLLTRWLTHEPWPPWYEGMVLMFQKEVAGRLVAHPSSKSYGRLAVLTQWRTIPEILFDIGPEAFVPPPKVTSSVVRFHVRPEPAAVEVKCLETVTMAAFNQRRKMLRQSLKSLNVPVKELLEKASLDERLRADALAVDDFVRLARIYDSLRSE